MRSIHLHTRPKPRLARFIVGALLVATAAYADRFDWAGKVELDAEGLRSDDPKRRLEAVHRLAMDTVHLSQPFLLGALTDTDRSVRLEAGRALGLGGSTAAIPALIDWLADADPRTRSVAAEALGEIGGPIAEQALTRSLGDSDPTVRQSAVKSLGNLALRGSPTVVAALLPRLSDDKSQVRRETVEQLEQIGDKRATIPLVSRFADTSKDVARAAVRAAGMLGDRAAIPALVRAMSDPDEAVRRQAVQSLGRLGADNAVDALLDQFGKANTDSFRSSIAYALGQIAATRRSDNATETAMRVLVDDLVSSRTRIAAREALRIAGEAAVPALVARLAARTKGDVSSVVDLLGEIGDHRATMALTAELDRGRVAIPVVLRALGNTGDPQALIPVLSATSSTDAGIRLTAMQALRPLLGDDARASDVLIERLDDENIEVRVLAANYLGVLATASPKLEAIAASAAPLRVRIAAIDALGAVAAAGKLVVAPAALVDILRAGPQSLRVAASTALSYVSDPAVLPLLISEVRTGVESTRREIVRAIGAILRRHNAPAGRSLLRDLVRGKDVYVAIAAVRGLAAARHPDDVAALRALFRRGPELRCAAAWALGEVGDAGATPLLVDALSSPDDRLSGAAAWALGEIAAGAPINVRGTEMRALTDRWLHVARVGGWAASINGTAALGRALWAQPSNARKPSTAHLNAMVQLAEHKSRLVRINAMFVLSSLAGDADVERAIARRLHDDPSPHVRAAAAVGLGRLGSGHAVLEASVRTDTDASVVIAAKAALNGSSAPGVRNEWRTFAIADQPDDQRLRNQPYFVHGPDGLVWATYADELGELASEHIPVGTSALHVWPADRESSY